ncbi:hypothetical protein EV644_13432 [Kribbella orskensis]|uniref:Lipoprotein n=1 Tax=Kribbella orskensis TaxID=2512216 RepID=A0ABY2B7K9_9ACTN|nr:MULTISPECIES: hypothetical protein [Kribbella]TCN30110.1 hypothetical protein EV642_13631 [Kribbella sp. VKM Ac-2500]TCO10284.1 hypothetical protein EV644_13432 [Kribbella orskensis]
MITVLSGCAVVTMDQDRTEYRSGYLVVDGALIVAVGNGQAPFSPRNVRYVDATGCLELATIGGRQVVAACDKLASRAR